jgi:hypothetical protein
VNTDPAGKGRRAAIVGGSALVLSTALGAALVLVHSGDEQETPGALASVQPSAEARLPEPVPASSAPAPAVAEPQPAAPFPAPGFPATPVYSPAPARAFQAGPPPPIDWNALVAAVVNTRNAMEVSLPAPPGAAEVSDGVSGGLRAATTLVTDLVMYAAYSGDGQNFLAQMQSSLNSLPAPTAGVPELPVFSAPDFSGLSAAFEAFAAQPQPIGVTGPPPQLPPRPATEQEDPEAPALPPADLSLMWAPPPTPPPPIWLPSSTQILGSPF